MLPEKRSPRAANTEGRGEAAGEPTSDISLAQFASASEALELASVAVLIAHEAPDFDPEAPSYAAECIDGWLRLRQLEAAR